jgi:hypothetical protein
MLSLQKGLMNGSITEQPPLSSVDPLSASLAGLSVVAIVNDRCVGSGFMSSRGTLSQSLSDAKLYPDLLTAQRSIKGFGSGSLGIDSESAVYFGTEVKLLGLAPGFAISKSRPNTMASGILNRLDNAALTAIVEQGDEGSKSCDQPSGSKKQGPGRSRRM